MRNKLGYRLFAKKHITHVLFHIKKHRSHYALGFLGSVVIASLIFTIGLNTFFPSSTFAASPLCASNASNQTYERISRVKVNTIQQNTTKAGYLDYTATPIATLNAGVTYPVEVDVGTTSTYQEYVKIWLDMNQDGIIQDPAELVYNENQNVTTLKTFTGNITIPSSAYNGQIYMRVIMQYNATPALCGTYTYGGTQDYLINVVGATSNPVNKTLTVTTGGSGIGNVTSSPAGINISSGINSFDFSSGATVALTAIPASNAVFSGRGGSCSGTSTGASITLNTGKTCTATFNSIAAPTAPTVSCTSFSNGTTGNFNQRITCTASNTSSPSAITKVQYSTNGGSSWSDTTSQSLTTDLFFPNEGTTDVRMRIVNAGGTGTTSTAYYIIRDTTAPTITITQPNTNPATSKTITGSVSDGTLKYLIMGDIPQPCESPLAVTNLYTTPLTFTGENQNGYSVCFKSTDTLGNSSYSSSNSIGGIDTTVPTITITQPNTNPATSKTITASSSDGTLMMTAGSIIKTCNASKTFISYASTTFTNDLDNGKYVCYRAIDSAGNTGYRSSSAIGGIDRIAPARSSKSTYTTGRYTGNQTSTFTYTDAGGITSGTPVSCTISIEGISATCNVTPNVCDGGGNCNTTPVTSNPIKLDKTAPIAAQVTAVPSLTNDTTPSYTFSSTEGGTISYGGNCASATTNASVGSNTINFNTLADAAYSNCTIKVTDAAGNQGNALAVNVFTVDMSDTVNIPDSTDNSIIAAFEFKGYSQSQISLRSYTENVLVGTKKLNTVNSHGKILVPFIQQSSGSTKKIEADFPAGVVAKSTNGDHFEGIINIPKEEPLNKATDGGLSNAVTVVSFGSTGGSIHFVDTGDNPINITLRIPLSGQTAGDAIDIYYSENNGSTWIFQTTTTAIDISGNIYTEFTTNHFTDFAVILTGGSSFTGTFVINNDASSTTSSSVTLNSSTTPAAAKMRFSDNGTTRSSRESYATTKGRTLPGSYGIQTVYAQFDAEGDGTGDVSSNDSINYSAPSGGGGSCTPGAYCGDLKLKILSGNSYCQYGTTLDFGTTGSSYDARSLITGFVASSGSTAWFCEDRQGLGTRALTIQSSAIVNTTTNVSAHTIPASSVSIKNPNAYIAQGVCTYASGDSHDQRVAIDSAKSILGKVGTVGEGCKIITDTVSLKVDLVAAQAIGQYSGTLTITVPNF